MIGFALLRLLAFVAMLASPAIAAQEAPLSVLDVTEANSLALEDSPGEPCPLKGSFCALCTVCLSAVPAIEHSFQVKPRARRFVPLEDARVGLLSAPMPIPP